MSIKLLVIFTTVLSVGISPSIAEQVVISKPAVQETNKANVIAFLDAKTIKQQAKRDKLKRVVNYLTTRVHKTAYVFSGATISGWDCSGMVRYAYKRWA